MKKKILSARIFLAAMVGGLARYLISTCYQQPRLSLGTLLVNYLGIFCLIYLVKAIWPIREPAKAWFWRWGQDFVVA